MRPKGNIILNGLLGLGAAGFALEQYLPQYFGDKWSSFPWLATTIVLLAFNVGRNGPAWIKTFSSFLRIADFGEFEFEYTVFEFGEQFGGKQNCLKLCLPIFFRRPVDTLVARVVVKTIRGLRCDVGIYSWKVPLGPHFKGDKAFIEIAHIPLDIHAPGIFGDRGPGARIIDCHNEHLIEVDLFRGRRVVCTARFLMRVPYHGSVCTDSAHLWSRFFLVDLNDPLKETGFNRNKSALGGNSLILPGLHPVP